MLTFITALKVFRFSRWDVEKFMPGVKKEWTTNNEIPYAHGVELEAAIKGEKYSKSLIESLLLDSVHFLPNDTFTFICSDGEYEAPYSKYTLARHSLLIRGYIEDYPEANEIDVSSHSTHSVLRAIQGIIEEPGWHLSDDVLDVLRLLTPPTDLYYFLFDLPGSFSSSLLLSTIRGMTEKERSDLLRVHHTRCQRDIHEEYAERDSFNTRELPNAGEGIAIAYAFSTIQYYLCHVYVPELHDPYPSYRFYEMVNLPHLTTTEETKKLLFSATFDDDCGFLPHVSCNRFLVEEILTIACCYTWDDVCIALAMLGVKHPLLKNEDVNRLAPYQVLLVPGLLSTMSMNQLRRDMILLSDLSEDNVVSILKPYLTK